MTNEMLAPIKSVLSGLKVLSREVDAHDTTAMKRSVKDITISTNMALNVLRDMLMYDRIKGDMMKLHLQFTPPWPLIGSVVAALLIQVNFSYFSYFMCSFQLP